MTNETIIEDLRLAPMPGWWEDPWAWVATAAGLIVMGWLWRRWRRGRPLPLKALKPTPPGPPAHIEALRRLGELRARHAGLTAYEVALECSDILRRFVEGRFASPIRYQTTREFLGHAQANPDIGLAGRIELGGFLEFFDEIKFAEQTAAPERTARAIDEAEGFVRKCIQAPAGSEQAGGTA